MKLLIAVDSAGSSGELVGAVAALPWPNGTTANVLSVVNDADIPLEVWREAGYGITAVRKEMKRRGEQISAAALDRLKQKGVPAEVTVTRGDPRVLIPFFARKKWASDLIFVGAHVPRDLEHWMVGSVARSVVASASCSVQIVRSLKTGRTDGGMRILLATDGSQSSTAAASAIAGRPWPEWSEFRVISVEEPWTLKRSRVMSNEQADEAVRNAGQLLSSAALKTSSAVLSGHPRESILEESQKWGADLIVVGSHGRRGVKRFMLGSVSEAVAMNAHSSVEVVRDPAALKRRNEL
jgi:nucleotide-binding universal stress UspA family protein